MSENTTPQLETLPQDATTTKPILKKQYKTTYPQYPLQQTTSHKNKTPLYYQQPTTNNTLPQQSKLQQAFAILSILMLPLAIITMLAIPEETYTIYTVFGAMGILLTILSITFTKTKAINKTLITALITNAITISVPIAMTIIATIIATTINTSLLAILTLV